MSPSTPAAFPAAGSAAWPADGRPAYEGGGGGFVFDFTKGFPAALADPGLTSGRAMFDASGVLVYADEQLFQHSLRLDLAPWAPLGNATLTPNALANPIDRAVTAALFTAGDTSFDSIFRQSVGAVGVAGVPFASTTYAKKGNHRYVGFRLPNNTATDASGDHYTFFDFDTETWTEEESGSAVTTKTVVLADGWYRLGVFAPISGRAVAGATDFALTESDGNVAHIPAGTETVYLYAPMAYRGDDFIDFIETPTTAAAYKPRTKAHYYDGAAWQNGGLLWEGEDRTNSILYSTSIPSGWNNNWAGGLTITANTATAPDGLSSADELARVDSADDAVFQDNTLIAATEYCASRYIKTVDAARGRTMVWTTPGGSVGDVAYDWTAGVPSTQASNFANNITYEDVAAGWYRLSFSGTTHATENPHRLFIWPERASGGDGRSDLAWHNQLELGALSPSMPIITGSAAVLRTKDHSIRPPLPESFDFGDFTAYFEVYFPIIAAATSKFYASLGADNGGRVGFSVAATNRPQNDFVDLTNPQNTLSPPTAISDGTVLKVASGVSKAQNVCGMAVNNGGVKEFTSATLTIDTDLLTPALSYIGEAGWGGSITPGPIYIRKRVLYPSYLGQAAMEALVA